MLILKIERDKECYKKLTAGCEQDTQWTNSQDLNKYGQSVTMRR